MNHRISRWVLVLLAAMLALGATAYAQSVLVLSRPIVANGGGMLSGGAFTLVGAVGQGEASTPVQNGAFTLAGGGLAGGILLTATPSPSPTATASPTGTTLPSATPTTNPTQEKVYLPVLRKA